MTHPEAERIARLEEQNKYLTLEVAALRKELEQQSIILREVRDALLSARGARWALMSLIGVSGTLGAIIANWWPK
jgi:hypothetical protein